LDLAIVGLDQSGKTTIFDALARGHAQHGDARREQLAVVKIPDERLDRLAALVEAEKITHAELRLHDLPALFEKGRAASGEAAESLSRADGLMLVVRAFRRPDVPHPRGEVDPVRDVDDFLGSMLLHDLDIIERRQEKLETQLKSAQRGEREEGLREQQLLARTHERLDGGRALRDDPPPAEDARLLGNYGLLTMKPLLMLVNLDEEDIPRAAQIETEYRERFGAGGTFVVAMSARLEAELAELEPAEAEEFRRELGAPEPALGRLLSECQRMLGLVTFYTLGKESRAWTLPAGGSALQAAGRIHTDIERGFVRAEVIGWQELLDFGSYAGARKQGRLRSEGKTYVVQDGDVINVLFSN
jgi:GTP-binding protein YchF